MFIREVKKQRSKDSKTFYQYNLVQASRIDGKVKQKVILYLGSDPLLEDKGNQKTVLEILKSKIFGQPDIFPDNVPAPLLLLAASFYEKYLIKYGEPEPGQVSIPPAPERAEMHNVDVKGLEVSDVKSFGSEHLCKQVVEKLKLKECLLQLGFETKQADKALIAIVARAVFSSSEYKTAQLLDMNSELTGCFDYRSPITHKQLYTVSDQLYNHKDKIDSFLYNRVTDLFDLEDKLVIFDISNTYFETGKKNSKLAAYGRSKEKRNDCPLVVFTGVINAQGFIRHSRIYEGNKPDTATLSDMVADLEKYSGKARKTIVMDAGIATEDNLELIREKGYEYVCVSRKRLKDPQVAAKVSEFTDRDKNKVELAVFHPEGSPDTWMYVQSDAKRKKEASMAGKLAKRFEEELESIRAAISKKGGTKKIEKVWERIGRVKQKYSRVSGRYLIGVEQKEKMASDIKWEVKPDPVKDEKEKGVYFIRTSYTDPKEKELWQIYNTIREVESTFRCLKSDLGIRPVFHQKDGRIESHIYLTILAYQLVNTIRHMLKEKGINHDWKNILRIMSTHTIQTIELPTDKKTIHLRKPSKPIKEVQEIYSATGCEETQKAIKKYVVYH
ncbi:IS1634 family transposase [Algoriphagus resistens]|uniref:IS1634 family transposase n=1 Tax=Algoriphagus resistens TaxID=1750590 RepID=UPI0007168E90|nr:IS1634 family transposase [Algoriphagus resistens]